MKQKGMLENVIEQFDYVADLTNLNPNIKKILREANNELVIHFPVRMDNGEIEIFRGYRVQHSNALGPYKGGLRFHPTADLDSIKALAFWMTFKASLAGLPYGGAKGGIQMDPKDYSKAELERITRRFTYALGDNIGPEYDIPAPDINTNAQTMAWILDAYVSTKSPSERSKNLHIVTGKPVGSGGLQGRDRATGFGVYLNIKYWYELKNETLQGKTFIIQGFGNVGYWASHFLEKDGAKLVGVQDAYGSIANKKGILVEDLFTHIKETQSVVDFKGAEAIEKNDFFALNCDICIPAALGNQITNNNVNDIKATLIAEGANGPVSVDAERVLLKKGVTIIPDILCNSGGVMGSYLEWLQNRNSEIWELDEILEKLSKRMKDVFTRVVKTSEEKNLDLRTTAFFIAIERIEKSYVQRGIFP